MNDIILRIALVLIAGLTYLSGVVPNDLTFSELGSLPVSVWMMFIINILTAFASPSVIRKLPGVKK